MRLSQIAARYKTTAERLESLIGFMRVVSDSQPTYIMCCNANGLIIFANQLPAAHYGIPLAGIPFKPMVSVLGPVKTKLLDVIHQRVIGTGRNETHLFHFEEPAGTRAVATDHVHLPAEARQQAAVLTVFHDITELTRERDRSEARLNQPLVAMVGVVDQRDSYSANHSARVSEVAQTIAPEMDLDHKEVRTVDLAGRLMNIGKIVIPPGLLTKTGQLTDEERQMLARSFVISAELLTDVESDGPVVEDHPVDRRVRGWQRPAWSARRGNPDHCAHRRGGEQLRRHGQPARLARGHGICDGCQGVARSGRYQAQPPPFPGTCQRHRQPQQRATLGPLPRSSRP